MRRCWGAPAYFFAWFISDFSRYSYRLPLTDFFFSIDPLFCCCMSSQRWNQEPCTYCYFCCLQASPTAAAFEKELRGKRDVSFNFIFLYMLQLRCGYCGAVVYVLMKIDPCCRCCKDRFPSLPPSILGMASSSSRFNVSFVALYVHVTEQSERQSKSHY